jgi:hypothetical protein
VFFSLFIIKIPKSSKRWSIEKREREREKVLKKEEGKRKGFKSLCKNTCKTDDKMDQNPVHVLTGISPNALGACLRNNRLRAIGTRKSRAFRSGRSRV